MKFHFSTLLCTVAALITFSAPVYASSETSAPAEKKPAAPAVVPEPPKALLPGVPERKEDSPAESITPMQSYVAPTFENMARTLWGMNVHDLRDDEAIDNFLKITECDLYTRFFLNEFEWKKIREATRVYLEKYKGSFPRRYEYIQPLMLDRYDFNLKGFALTDKSQFTQSSRLEMASNLAFGANCYSLGLSNLNGYPSSVMLTIKQPFKLSFVRVNEDLAQEYLRMIDEKEVDLTNGRPAYIRFRVRLDRYMGTVYDGQTHYGNFGGMIETIEVFADRDLMFKLYEQALY